MNSQDKRIGFDSDEYLTPMELIAKEILGRIFAIFFKTEEIIEEPFDFLAEFFFRKWDGQLILEAFNKIGIPLETDEFSPNNIDELKTILGLNLGKICACEVRCHLCDDTCECLDPFQRRVQEMDFRLLINDYLK